MSTSQSADKSYNNFRVNEITTTSRLCANTIAAQNVFIKDKLIINSKVIDDSSFISSTPSGVTPGSYTLTNMTVNEFGQVTAASNGTALVATGVTPGSYTSTNLTVNEFGQLTAASNGVGGGITSASTITTINSPVLWNNATGTIVENQGATTIAAFSGPLQCSAGVAVGQSNLFLGASTLNNIASASGRLTTTGRDNVGIGTPALAALTIGNGNTAVGNNALLRLVDGSNNIAIGKNALQNNATGGSNIAIGTNVMGNLTADGTNVVIGEQSLFRLTSGSNNTAVGSLLGLNLVSSSSSAYLGMAAGSQIKNALSSVGIGAQCMNAVGATTFNNSVVVGFDAMPAALNCVETTAIGYQAGTTNSSAVNNIFIGARSAASAAVNNAIVIGPAATATASGQLVLHTTSPAGAISGIVTLVGGTVVVGLTTVTGTSRILLTCQTPGGTPGFLRVSTRTNGTSFTILSSSGTDTSDVAYFIFEG